MKKKLRMALSKTKFSNCDMVAVAAKPDEENVGGGPIGISNLVNELSWYVLEWERFCWTSLPPRNIDMVTTIHIYSKQFYNRSNYSLTKSPTERDLSAPFLFAVDHCFSIRGQGTIMTGTVLQGTVNVNDVSFESLKGGPSEFYTTN